MPIESYRLIGAEIQKHSSFNLWVAVPHCLADLCDPLDPFETGLSKSVAKVVSDARLQGFSGGDVDTFIGGHSLGGVGARHLVDLNNNFGGLLLFGTQYLSNANKGEKTPGYPHDLATWPTAFLTITGEVDQVSAVHLVPVLSQYDKLSETDKKKKYLAIIPGMNHSQFGPGFNVTGDNAPEISNEDAAAAVGEVTGAWLNQQVHSVASDKDAAVLNKYMDSYTRPILSAFIEAQALEGTELCRQYVNISFYYHT